MEVTKSLKQESRHFSDERFNTATLGEKEYVIGNTQRVASHANIDDTITHWTLNLRDGGNGNIKR